MSPGDGVLQEHLQLVHVARDLRRDEHELAGRLFERAVQRLAALRERLLQQVDAVQKQAVERVNRDVHFNILLVDVLAPARA
jgi:hypothetical protein